MNQHVDIGSSDTGAILHKPDAGSPAFKLIGPREIVVKSGVSFRGRTCAVDTPIDLPDDVTAGQDYGVAVTDNAVEVIKLEAPPDGVYVLGGFHFAPGGNAAARSGGDGVPQISPLSLWDIAFRPACPDPRGMVLVGDEPSRFWCDIYLLGVNHHTDGTSAFGVTIADGRHPPQKPNKGKFKKFDYATAIAVLAHHGKQLLGIEEFFAAAFGVTERISVGRDPCETGLDAPRTSRWGLMQATGNMWVWGHNGDPDDPQPMLFGGYWIDGAFAGSRASYWVSAPSCSLNFIGARGRCGHLQLA